MHLHPPVERNILESVCCWNRVYQNKSNAFHISVLNIFVLASIWFSNNFSCNSINSHYYALSANRRLYKCTYIARKTCFLSVLLKKETKLHRAIDCLQNEDRIKNNRWKCVIIPIKIITLKSFKLRFKRNLLSCCYLLIDDAIKCLS